MAIRAEGIEIFEQAVLRVRLDCFVASACRNDVRTPRSFVVPANQRVRLLPARWQAPGPIRRVACFERRCPDDVAARSDRDALFQGAIETFGEFGHAEILDGPESLVAQQLSELGRVEKNEPGL